MTGRPVALCAAVGDRPHMQAGLSPILQTPGPFEAPGLLPLGLPRRGGCAAAMGFGQA